MLHKTYPVIMRKDNKETHFKVRAKSLKDARKQVLKRAEGRASFHIGF